MKRIAIILAIVVVLTGLNSGFDLEESVDMKKAKKIHSDALVFDAHAHPMIYLYATPERLELGKKTDTSQVDFVTMKKGGLHAMFLSVPLVKDPSEANPIGLETAEGLPLITYHLLKRDYKEEDIKKFLGGNLLRVFEEVESVAGQ